MHLIDVGNKLKVLDLISRTSITSHRRKRCAIPCFCAHAPEPKMSSRWWRTICDCATLPVLLRRTQRGKLEIDLLKRFAVPSFALSSYLSSLLLGGRQRGLLGLGCSYWSSQN